MACEQQWKYLSGFVCSLIWAIPLPAQDRGFVEPAAYSQESPIPSPHVATTASQIPAANQWQLEGDFPSLETAGEDSQAKAEAGGFATPLVTVVSSLAIVLGLFAGLVFLTRKFGRGAVRAGSVPSDVLQTLGSTAIDPRTRVTMLRCGSRIVVAAQTASGIHPLCEITDPREVHELTVACTGGAPSSFADTLKAAQQKQTESEPASRRRRLFATA